MRFGRLVTVFSFRKRRGLYWQCRCDCGKEANVREDHLLSAAIRSCGCLRREMKTIHGMSKTRIHRIWRGILRRCGPSGLPEYAGRGIKVCARWHSFAEFYSDMGDAPFPGAEVDRIDNDGDYEPGNCRWADRFTQMKNTRKNSFLTLDGQTRHLAQWAREKGMHPGTLLNRLQSGWPVRQAIEQPVKRGQPLAFRALR